MQTSKLGPQFWSVFGKYMAPVPSAEGEKINWINYKTGAKFIRFNMQCTDNAVFIALELSHPDIVLQQQQFDQVTKFKKQFQEVCGSDWQWQRTLPAANNKTISSIVVSIDNINIWNQADWPKIISFLKMRLIGLDKFWCDYKFALQA
jgi:hypothetical protein